MSSFFKRIKLSEIVKDISITFLLRIVGIGLMYLSTLLITNFFGAEIYGKYSLSITILSVFALVFSFGLPHAVLKLTSDESFFKKEPLNNYLRKAFLYTIVFSVFGSSIFYIYSDLFSNIFDGKELVKYIKLIALLGGAFVLFNFSLEYLKGRKKFLLFSLFMYVIPHVLLIFGILFFRKRIEEDGSILLLIHLLVYVVLLIILITKLDLKKRTINYPSKKILHLSFNLMISSSLVFLINWTDVFMLGVMVSKVELGIYNVAYKVASLCFIVISTLNIIVAPKISQLYSQNNFVELKSVIHKFAKIATLATIVPVILLCVFGTIILSFFGTEFTEGYNVLIILALSFLFNSFFGSVGQLLNMTIYQKEFKNFVFISLCINVIINLILIPKFGIIGASIASLTAGTVLNIMCVVFSYKKFGFLTIYKFW